MVKFGKSKLKALNKLAKKQSAGIGSVTNKILKKKHNADKKVIFQREVLVQKTASENVSKKELLINELVKKVAKPQQKKNVNKVQETASKPKPKPVKKQKQRQKAQINDTKLLLNLMKK